MMSVIIKNMKMPENCFICRYVCTMHYSKKWRHKRHPDCPLVEVPPHGRLIDVDAFVKYVCKIKCGRSYEECRHIDVFGTLGCEAVRLLQNAPTVIEAEEGE